MRLNYKILVICCLSGLIFSNNSSYSQVTEDSCRKTYDAILLASQRGQFTMMDSLFDQFITNRCDKNRDYYRLALVQLKNRWLEDRYQINKADSIQRIIDSLEKNDGKANDLSFRIGATGAIGFAKRGSSALSGGVLIGIRKLTEYNDGLGIDIGLVYQKCPFNYNIVKHSDDNNNYNADGYILKGKGYVNYYELPIRVSYENPGSEDFGMGVGFAVGVVFKKIKNTFVKTQYHEYDYIQTYDPLNNRYIVTYKAEQNSNYNDKHFFKHKSTIDFFTGVTITCQVSDHVMLVLTPAYSFNIANKLKINIIDHPISPNHWSVDFCAFYFVSKRKKNLKPSQF